MEEQKEQPTTPISENTKVYNLILLDESGSMSAIYHEALTGLNETLQTIRMAKDDNPEQDHFVTLIAFNSGHYNEIFKGTPAEKANDITPEQYRPGGCTPLYDAMGRAIYDLRNHLDYLDNSSKKEDNVVLVTIITDGYENASKEYTKPAIKALVEEMRKNGWVFTYIGANQDVDKVAESMAINNSMAFQADSEGTKAMFAKDRKARKKFFGKFSQVSQGQMPREELDIDFFED
ncbi:MAG: VWA domain-containing protein [Muribaculaceae bacterium]|nr:VWA domain-containing protein [Muribaculaceae bacterium]